MGFLNKYRLASQWPETVEQCREHGGQKKAGQTFINPASK